MTLANAAYLGIKRFVDDRSKENWPNGNDDEKSRLIYAVYQQVLGRQYVLSSERLEGPESLFRRGYLSVREFVRQVAKSGEYRRRFFDDTNAYKFIELNFKHLLGRAPQNKAEALHHFTILQEKGFEAEIDSYLDSTEYQHRFGEEQVPFIHGLGYSAGQHGLQFSYLLQLTRGVAASVKGDIVKNQSRLNPAIHKEAPLPVISPNAKGSTFRSARADGVTRQGVGAGEEGRTFRVEISGFNNYRLHKRSNRVRFIPFNKLLEYQQQIHREGGRIASITPVN
ncbi:phycobilisome rod-core linker polypeptide [Cyanobium sp. Morenito 9A2]|uniref:phycobilisome rod-core linker polypeptide n=1 Tax=Cyanobium sp. Morenito 9A2 TaxID=2823718 RepID=UPI0020CCA393|nr:phycobilisome rod-core linker polypeptide [Cyanobium sp. Morenito 9A2]MCP9851175.1 phycobilisome linker polypeptide [Cyanobium sp. Morenito 9A2]